MDLTGRRWVREAAVAVALAVAAAGVRLIGARRPDGFFYDDAWQVFAATGPVRRLPLLGQAQPLFTVGLMALERVFGHDYWSMVGPAMVAGILGPPALYLALRWCRIAWSAALLLGAALAVSQIHAEYSAHVKPYTLDLLVVLGLAVATGWLTRRTWRTTTAVAWAAASIVVASFSSFALIAAGAAGAVLLLHAEAGDRLRRLVAVGAQAVATAGLLAWTTSTFDVGEVAAIWRSWDGMITGSPADRVPGTIHHLDTVLETFPGGPPWISAVLLLAAGGGLLWEAWRGPRAVVARYLCLLVVVAVVGANLGRLPLGVTLGARRRADMWLFPAVAFGLAATLDRARHLVPAARRGTVDAVAVAAGIALIASGFGDSPIRNPPGGRIVTEQAVAELRPGDVLWVYPHTVHGFALWADLPYRVQPARHESVGFLPRFADPHIVLLPDAGPRPEHLDQAGDADRVLTVTANLGKSDRALVGPVREELERLGFEQDHAVRAEGSDLVVWTRAPTG